VLAEVPPEAAAAAAEDPAAAAAAAAAEAFAAEAATAPALAVKTSAVKTSANEPEQELAIRYKHMALRADTGAWAMTFSQQLKRTLGAQSSLKAKQMHESSGCFWQSHASGHC
jgi:hypothetical protein